MVVQKALKKLKKVKKMLPKKQIPANIARSATSTCSWIRKTALGLPRRPAVIRAIANGVVVVVAAAAAAAAVVVPVSLRSSHLPMDAEVVLPLPRPRGAAISICAAMATDVVVFPPLPDHLPGKWSVCKRQKGAPSYNGASRTAATYGITPLGHRWACERQRLTLVMAHGVAMGLLFGGRPLRSGASTRVDTQLQFRPASLWFPGEQHGNLPKIYFGMICNGV